MKGRDRAMENTRIADIFDQIADLLSLTNANPFRIRSYRAAARTIRDLSEDVQRLARSQGDSLTDLPNIGESHSEKIREIINTGTCEALDQLRKKVPGSLPDLLDVPGLGPKKVGRMYRDLNIKSLEDLKVAAEKGKIAELPGMGEKTEENILDGLSTLEQTSQRFLYHEASDYVRSLGNLLDGIDTISQWEIAGSFRRAKETVGDLDVIVEAGNRSLATKGILDYDPIEQIIAQGNEKVSVRLNNGLQIDFRYFEPESFGSALAYFTGAKAHNIAMRKLAQERDWKLNEYGLFKNDHRLGGKTEESVYHRLNLDWIPPELREDRGELKAAKEKDLPKLVDLEDIRGDLHAHTKATDGVNTLEEMARAAVERGYEYLAITEHSKAVTIAKGMNEDRLRKHMDKIRELNEDLDDLWLIPGVEVDILKDGALDLDEKLLSELDWVVASVHSHFRLDENEMTDRLLGAINSGVVHCLGHLTARMIGKRDPIKFDMDRILDACSHKDVCLEINSQPDRLDLPDIYCRRAKEAGVRFSISTDAHNISELDFMRYGALVARRGWLEKQDIITTMSARRLGKRLKDRG